MRDILVPVSVGELLDKITILRIKNSKITDEAKLVNINKELAALERVCEQHGIDSKHQLVQDLQSINLKLWQIEDDIRDKERAGEFDDGFIRLARAVYVTNDERFAGKRLINQTFGSQYVEEKSYQEYRN